MLKIGTTISGESGESYKVLRLLGAGGQGEVYEVESKKNNSALKWYFKSSATETQKSILGDLITKGAPDASFLWPQDLAVGKPGEPFGYVMPLRPQSFKSIVDMMKRRAEPSFWNLCRAAFYLTRGYEKLHTAGYAYRDISFGNVFFDPDNGNVLICDNDNVSAKEKSSVYGTPRFMAPEIVTGKAKPSRNTDLFSLAVLLFYMFMLNHPLEGKLEAEIKCMDVPAMNKLYGTNPVFIYDPDNKSNRPVKGYHDNAIIFWDLYPEFIKELFITSFTIGLSQPAKRVTEKQWMDAIANLMFGILHCSCGSEVFYNDEIVKNSASIICWNCQKALQIPLSIVIDKNRVLLMGNTKLYAHHILGNYDIDTAVAQVVQNPNNPNLWGMRNEGKDNWTYVKTDGTQTPVAPGKTVAIAKGTKINFGSLTGEFV